MLILLLSGTLVGSCPDMATLYRAKNKANISSLRNLDNDGYFVERVSDCVVECGHGRASVDFRGLERALLEGFGDCYRGL